MAVKLGMLGLGWFANFIAGAVSEKGAGKVTVEAACDVNPKKRKEFKERFLIRKAYSNSEDLFEDPMWISL